MTNEDKCREAISIEEARGIAARCWCTEETKHIEMDVRLAEAFAQAIVQLSEENARLREALEYHQHVYWGRNNDATHMNKEEFTEAYGRAYENAKQVLEGDK